MPTLPLVNNPAPADVDAPRRVVAPGGYEWWYFEAHDPVADLRVTAILFDGNPFHPGYLRRYAWYRRFPTRLLPPLPCDFPGVFVRVYEKDRLVVGAMRQHKPGACRLGETGVSVGGDGFTRAADGAMRLTIDGAVDLTFRPNGSPAPAPPRFYRMARGSSVRQLHGWIVSNPICAASGEVTVRGRCVSFDGFGYQDHNYGAEPVHLAARRWFWSCAWLDGRPYVVAEAVPRRGPSRGIHLLGTESPGSAVWDGRTRWRIPYPTIIDFGQALRLDEPRVIESLPIMAQLRYRARVGDVTTTAVAHVVEPGRASLPVIARAFDGLVISRRKRSS
ncbi:MAG TPA: hypothetical protein VGR35_17315 [Tepidisphaeraceae bacterium]|nr:hypothetical protein [Tepidisphaeraceae bacterium]